MEKDFLEELERWHEEDAFQRIIEAIQALPGEEMDYGLAGHLARAYNNRGNQGDYDRAIDCLRVVEEQGREDALWHYRMGYALYGAGREEEAAAELKRVLALAPEDRDAWRLLNRCHEAIQHKQGRRQEDFHPEVYNQEQMERVEGHINHCFGAFEQVFHEIISPDIHVDICLIPPAPERPYYTLVTMGMGAHRMNVPQELRESKLERAELAICLPPDWKLGQQEEAWYWPLRWLKELARLPGQEDTWLAWGHTVDHGSPFAEDTALCGAILVGPGAFGPEAAVCPLPDGDEINFYQVIPLYREEIDFKMANGAEALLDKMDASVQVVDKARLNVCGTPARQKAFRLSPRQIRPLLTDWEGPEGCLATDRILVDGRPVGYCYRDEPAPGVPDSGWRFMAGDETEEYMGKSDHSGVYALNTICNYDPDVMPLLRAPAGSSFQRGEDGKFYLLEEKE